MLVLAKEAAAAFRSKSVGARAEVLWESAQSGVWSGYTNNYIRVFTRTRNELTNILSNVELTKPYKEGMWAELTENKELE